MSEIGFTIEVENRLLGSRQHRRASVYPTLDAARAVAKVEAGRSRSFATYNVLDAKGRVVESFTGER